MGSKKFFARSVGIPAHDVSDDILISWAGMPTLRGPLLLHGKYTKIKVLQSNTHQNYSPFTIHHSLNNRFKAQS